MITGYKVTGADRVFNILNRIFLLFVFIAVFYPIMYVLSASISNPDAVISGRVWLYPVGFNLDGYREIFKYKLITSGYANSLFYMVVGTSINIAMTVTCAYPLSRKDYKQKGIVMKLFVITMIFQAGMIPDYLLIKDIGLLDTRWALLLPKAILPYNLIVTRTYFQTAIPDDLLEAARIDGSNDYNFFFKIVLPLSKQIIAVITLFYAVAHWNRFFDALLYLSDTSKFPLQIVLRDILVSNQVDSTMMDDVQSMISKENLQQLLKYSLIIVANLPLMILYPFIQKYFVKGVMVGAIKG